MAHSAVEEQLAVVTREMPAQSLSSWGIVHAVVWAVVAWVIGVALQMRTPQAQPDPTVWGLGLLIAAVLALSARNAVWGRAPGCSAPRERRCGLPPAPKSGRPSRWAVAGAALAWVLLWGILGHQSTQWRTAQRLDNRLAHVLEGQVLMLRGVVEELPRRQPQGLQFILHVEQAVTLGGQAIEGVPRRIWMGWWTERSADPADLHTLPDVRPGQRWQLPAVLKRPHGTLNPQGFDAERWFLERDLGASGQVPSAHRARARLLGQAAPKWRTPEAWRADLRDRIDAGIRDPRLAGLVAGLTIGDQSAVDAQDWALFRDAGVAHVLAISGLHITMFAALATPMLAWVWRHVPGACLWVPANWAGALGGLCLAGLYALLSGWALPAQRTVIMLAVVTAARWTAWRGPPLLVWVWAAGPVVLIDPWAVGQASFWLSFAAVGLLMLSPNPTATRGHLDGSAQDPVDGTALGSRVRGAVSALMGMLRQQVVATVGLAPLAAVFFHQVSVVGVVANLLTVPWITLLITPGALLGLMWPSLWGMLPVLMAPLKGFLEGLVAWPAAVWVVPSAAPGWSLAALLGAALLVMPLPGRVRLAGALLMLPLMMPAPTRVPAGRFAAWGLDVGQGSAVLVRTAHHQLLVDAGPAGWAEGADAGSRVVLPALMSLGVHRLDLLVVTHRDADHTGGVEAVLRRVMVQQLTGSLETTHRLRRTGVPWRSCVAPQAWHWDGVRFEVVYPLHDLSDTARAVLKPNTISCVIRIEDAHGQSLLIAADIEAAQEAELVETRASQVPGGWSTTALVVPHHGSRTSSTAAFIAAVDPRWALVQAGYRNRYGHPSPEVMNRYARAGVEVAVSPWCGAWYWPSAQMPRCWREEARRHWHERPPEPQVPQAGPPPVSPPLESSRESSIPLSFWSPVSSP